VNNFVEFTNGQKLEINNANNENLQIQQRLQIKETIREHLKKQKNLAQYNIKVLSLFFIDRVANYKINGLKKGKFAIMFEESFLEVIKENPQFKDVISFSKDQINKGYFSIDKDTKGESDNDKNTYSLIMKEKEKLLSFEEPTSFIFSHSALKEGWDNPNVFQICTLNETTSNIKKRQEIGRGLRLAVDSTGRRIHNTQINTLSVITNSSYERFASDLQKEFKDEGLSFGVIEYTVFLKIKNDDDTAKEIHQNLIEKGYLNQDNTLTDKFNPQDKNFELVIDAKFDDIKSQIIDIIKELKTYDVNLTIYDPWANPEDVMHEYKLTTVKTLSSDKFDAIVLGVAHKEFLEIDLEFYKNANAIIYDVKGILKNPDGKL
jgi:type III restriction enzyme